MRIAAVWLALVVALIGRVGPMASASAQPAEHSSSASWPSR